MFLKSRSISAYCDKLITHWNEILKNNTTDYSYIKKKKNLVGEIYYRGKNIYCGYASDRNHLNDLKKIKILKTGDIGYKKKNFLFITGRISRFIKIQRCKWYN